jgi:hypothetical protein
MTPAPATPSDRPWPFPADGHLVALNQAGFERNGPKRFTAPRSPEGTPFRVCSAAGGAVRFEGRISGGIGDFSSFQPANDAGDFIVVIPAGGGLTAGQSDPFSIRENFWQDFFWQPAVDFLIDVRSVVGTHPSAFGGCAWRDGTYYDFNLASVVLMHLADPARHASMPRQIDWAAERARVLDPHFKYIPERSAGPEILEAVRRYYREIPAPAANATDVEKLIHWGAGFIAVQPESIDRSGSEEEKYQIHLQTLEQVAYTLWAWPSLKHALPVELHDRLVTLVFGHWGEAGGFGVSPWWDMATYHPDPSLAAAGDVPAISCWLHPYKGRHAPGHSIAPNVVLHEIALRLGRADAPAYLDAAIAQAKWIIEHLDWNDPRTTKGHRFTEPRTITGLAWLLQRHPDRAPEGLREKIEAWAEIAISRSNNLWDYRRYDLEKHWSIPVLNDVGNLLAFPAAALAAAGVLGSSPAAERLRVLAIAQADHTLGRNPLMAAAPHRHTFGFTGLKRGWPASFGDDITARLELCRGSFSTAPGTEMYPFNPEGAYRHLEGWNAYGAAWCTSLAYIHWNRLGISPSELFPLPTRHA